MNLHARQEACPIHPQVRPDKFGDETLISLTCINVQNVSVLPPGVAQYVLYSPNYGFMKDCRSGMAQTHQEQ